MINTSEYQKYIESIVRKIVSMFPDMQLSAEDLRQRGWLELIEATGRYDAGKGAKFTTYAYRAVEEGIRREAIFQIDRSGVTGRVGIALTDVGPLNEDSNAIRGVSEDAFVFTNAENENRDSIEQLRGDLELLTENEKKVLYMAYGIDCERCANAGKIAKVLGIRELEVKRALQSGKRKLEELADGRKQDGAGA